MVIKPRLEHPLTLECKSHQCYTPVSFHLILTTTPSYQWGRIESLREESITCLRSYNYHLK